MEHGKLTTYRDHGCRCVQCRGANTEAMRKYRKRVAYGRVSKTSPETSIVRLRELRAAGWKWRQIEAATRCNRAVLQRLLYGDVNWVTRETESRILNAMVKPPELPRGLVDSTGTRRRLQALVAQGWTFTQLADRLGKANPQGLYATAVGTVCQERTRRAVAALFSELWAVTVPDTTSARRARYAARKHGWVSALAWDDIDDPNETPTTVGTGRADVLAELDHFRTLGESPAQAIRAVGSNPGALEQMARRKNRPDLAAWVAAA